MQRILLSRKLKRNQKTTEGIYSVFGAIDHQKLETKLNDSQNGLQDYVELKAWLEKETGKFF